MGIISLVHGELTKVWGNAMLMRWDLHFMWVSTARAQNYQVHRMTNAPLAKLQWFVINSTHLCLELAQKRLLLNLPQRCQEIHFGRRPKDPTIPAKVFGSPHENRTIPGGARYSQYLPQHTMDKDGKSGKSNHDASDWCYVWIDQSPQILDKKSTALKTEAPLLLVLDKQCPCPALPKQQAWKTGTNQQQLCGLSINASSFERLLGVQDNTESEAARIWKKHFIPSCDAVMLHPECWAWPNQAAQPRPLIKFTNHPWPSQFTKWFV